MFSNLALILKSIPNWRTLLQTAGNKGIVHNIPFILYCSTLALVYITMNHYAENTIRRINETARQLKEDRWRYIDEKSQLMFLTKESQLETGAAAIGLEKTKVPPYKIQIIK
jgi:hypothetical protein